MKMLFLFDSFLPSALQEYGSALDLHAATTWPVIKVDKSPHFHPLQRHSLPRNDPPKKSLGPAEPLPHRCRTFPLLSVQVGMVSSAACECGAEQTVDHVVL